MRDRRLRNGYSDLGALLIPVLPQPIILVDRKDGTKWLVSWNDTTSSLDGLGHITINSDISMGRQEVAISFPPGEGPLFGEKGEIMLFIRDGRLGIDVTEYNTGESDMNGAPVYARKAGSRTLRQLYPIDNGIGRKHYTLAWTDNEEPHG
jgi:hypothetical protein